MIRSSMTDGDKETIIQETDITGPKIVESEPVQKRIKSYEEALVKGRKAFQ
jgi:hypothetical protein